MIDGQDDPPESGARFENLVACHLFKHGHFLNDSAGESLQLHDLRTTDGKAIDFVIANESGDATHFIEVKVTDDKPALALRQAAAAHPQAVVVQVVLRAPHAFDVAGIQIRPAAAWLAELAA